MNEAKGNSKEPTALVKEQEEPITKTAKPIPKK